MFWVVVAAPFALLGIAALIAPRSKVFRVAAALAAIFAVIDAAVFWSIYAEPGSSTSGLGIAALALIQSGFSVAVVVASVLSRRGEVR